MSPWIFPVLHAAVGGAGPYVDGVPWRVVIHSTEIPHADPDVWIPNWRFPSHIVADWERNKIRQCVGLDEAAKSLENLAGGVETNRHRCIQIEIQGHAAEAAQWPAEKLRWIGVEVLAPVVAWVRALGDDIDLSDVPAPGEIGGSASASAPQRMSYTRWTGFGGVCGHRHVPENAHWDAGGADLATIAAHAQQALDSGGEDEMTEQDWVRLQDLVRAVTAEQVDRGAANVTAHTLATTADQTQWLESWFAAIMERLDRLAANPPAAAAGLAADIRRLHALLVRAAAAAAAAG